MSNFDYSSISCFKQQPSPQVRYLVERNLDRLITLSLKQIYEFTNTTQTKVKAINQLKYTLLLGEQKITTHTQNLLKSLVKIGQLDIQNVSKYVSQIVQIIGYHVKSSYYIPLMMDILAQDQIKNSTKNTVLFLNMVSHMFLRSEGLENHVQQIAKMLAYYQCIFYDNDEGLLSIYGIAETLVTRLQKFDNEKVVNSLFSIILNVQATKSLSPQARAKASNLMEALAKKSGFNSVAELHKNEIEPILSKIISNKEYISWSKTSKDRFKFDTIVRNCHSEVIKFLPQILQILEYMINPQSDLQIRMDTLVLIEFMLNLGQIKQSLKPIAEQMMRKILVVAIQWKVGKPQIKIRKAGIINMILMIENQIIGEDQLLESYKDLIPPFKNCLNDDWAPELRLASCELLEKFLNATKQKIDTQQLRQLYPLLLERLDDSQDPIRKKITIAINVFFACRYVKLTESTFEYMVGAIFIHFDDNSEDIQDAIYVSLRFAANIDPEQVLKVAQSNLKKMKHRQKCQSLVEFCKDLIEQRKNE